MKKLIVFLLFLPFLGNGQSNRSTIDTASLWQAENDPRLFLGWVADNYTYLGKKSHQSIWKENGSKKVFTVRELFNQYIYELNECGWEIIEEDRLGNAQFDTTIPTHWSDTIDYEICSVEGIFFMEWVYDHYEKAGWMVEGDASDVQTTQTTWKIKGKKLIGWELPLTSKELWLKWFNTRFKKTPDKRLTELIEKADDVLLTCENVRDQFDPGSNEFKALMEVRKLLQRAYDSLVLIK